MIKGIYAGVFIAIASSIYIQIGGVVGAILFSIGLLVILNMNLKLFTGTIGYIENKNDIKENLIILIGNIIGCIILIFFPNPAAVAIVTTKLSYPFLIVLIKSIICGMFIYCAVSCYRKKKDYMVPVCVSGFILFGAEHCIADLCYIISAQMLSISTLIFLIIVTVGNSIGAIIFHKVDHL